MSTMIEAARAGDAARVRELLERDPGEAAARDENGLSAIMNAQYRGHDEVAGLLADAVAELDGFEAAATGRTERLRELLDADPELATAYSPDGFTALGFVAFFGHLDAARLLLERGADVHAVAQNENARVAPLASAAAGRHADVGALLLEHGADAGVRGQDGGYTPLHSAAQNGDIAFVELLLAHGADPAPAKDDGKTPADLATEQGHDEVVRLLEST